MLTLIPFSQMSRNLTPMEESGALSRSLGLTPTRLAMPPRRTLPSYHVGFVHPPIRPTQPWPSSRRAGPTAPRSAA